MVLFVGVVGLLLTLQLVFEWVLGGYLVLVVESTHRLSINFPFRWFRFSLQT